MKALVTGSAGFIGRHFARTLWRRGWDVRECDVADPLYPLDCLELFRRDDARYDLVVHAAARSPHRLAIDTEPESLLYNALLDAAMFEWAAHTRQARVLYLSSCAALDDDPDDYGALKRTGERLATQARRAGVPVTVVRPYSGYGEDQSEDFPFRAICERARRRENPLTVWGSGEQVRDWIHVDDVIAGALAVVESGTSEPVSLCTGVGTSIAELARLAATVAGYHPRIVPLAGKPTGPDRRVGDPSLLHRWYTPTVTLAEGVARALREVS